MIKRGFIFLICLATLWTNAAQAKFLKRHILALYNSKDDPTPFATNIHSYAEMPLNHLGLMVDYHDIQNPLPKANTLTKYRGLLIWFPSEQKDIVSKDYCEWLETIVDQGLKLVVLDQLGVKALQSGSPPYNCQKVYNKLGVKVEGDLSNNALFIEIDKKNPNILEFERNISLLDPIIYKRIVPVRDDVKTHLQISRNDLPGSQSSVVFTSNTGGFSLSTFTHYWNPSINKFKWKINPFEFFRLAFDWQEKPAIDTTTINGKRIFYTHIDGDGSFNISHIDKKTYSAEIIYNRIIKHFFNIPITVSFVAAYFDIPEYQTPDIQQIYKKIVSAPNVQVASHGYNHPLVWRKQKLAIEVPDHPYTDENELIGSVNKHQKLLVDLDINKRVNMFLWTGDCFPNEKQISFLSNNNILNMNGGDTRFDKIYDSYGFVKALGYYLGSHLQVYSSNSNENTYTNLWEGPFYGFNLLKETFERTGSPIRVKPMNIYYHYYSGERQASLQALIEDYEYALSQNIFALEANRFPPIVKAFFDSQIEQVSNNHFRVHMNGPVHTIRFDNDKRHVDLKKSTAVIGYKHEMNSLYISLDPTVQIADVYLTNTPNQSVYVSEASFDLSNVNFKNKNKISFTKHGWYKSQMVLQGLKPNTKYNITENQKSWIETTNKAGSLALEFKVMEGAGSPSHVEIKVAQIQ